MTWHTLPPELRETAEQTLTPRQLEVLQLHIGHGHSTRRIALQLNISETAVRDRLTRALQRLALELQKEDTTA